MNATAQQSPPRQAFWLPAVSLARRELVRFLRQRHRIIGALATPIVFWLLIGGGMGTSFRHDSGGERGEKREVRNEKNEDKETRAQGDKETEHRLAADTTSQSAIGNRQSAMAPGFLHYFFPGTLLMILLFTAIFSTISIIEDRHEGFLQSVLVAPVSRMAIVLGKVLGGTALAAGQGFLFLLLAPLVGFHFTPVSFVLAILVLLVVSFALTSLGFCIAWPMRSTQGFHAIMNLFLIPLWFLSGALFPATNAQFGLRYAMAANPLSYGLAALRQTMTWPGGGTGAFVLSLGISIAFAMALFALASFIATSRNEADLQ